MVNEINFAAVMLFTCRRLIMPVKDGEVSCILLNSSEIQLLIVLEYLQRVLVELVLFHQLDASLLLVLLVGFAFKEKK